MVGLGNPGPEYTDTRHNVGVRVVEAWAARRGWGFAAAPALESQVASGGFGDVEVALLLPQTFMNRSGRAVAWAAAHYGLADAGELLELDDDLDLPFGRLRLRAGGGAGGHRGLDDIQRVLERNDMPRLRVGIGHPGPGGDVVDYVLSPFSASETAALGELLTRGADALDAILRHGVAAAMNRVNAPPPADPAPADD